MEDPKLSDPWPMMTTPTARGASSFDRWFDSNMPPPPPRQQQQVAIKKEPQPPRKNAPPPPSRSQSSSSHSQRDKKDKQPPSRSSSNMAHSSNNNNNNNNQQQRSPLPPVPAFAASSSSTTSGDNRKQSPSSNKKRRLPPVPAFGSSTNDNRKRPPRSDDVIDLTLDDDDDDDNNNTLNKNKRVKVEAAAIKQEPGVLLKQEEESPPPPPALHIIFSIDFSRSMETCDVKTKNSKTKISRWDAVFACMDEFLTDQQQEQDKENSALVSVLIFNEAAQTLLHRMPLMDGKKVQKALETARKLHSPRGGTGFAAGFERARTLARNQKDEKVVVVFLSDGRPGDLISSPPKNADTAMQTHFRFKGRTFPAAGFHIEAMQKEHRDNLSFHFICLCSSGKKWLKYLSQRYGGTFHRPNLALEDDDTSNMPAAAPAKGRKNSRQDDSDADDDDDDGDLNDSDYEYSDVDEVVDMKRSAKKNDNDGILEVKVKSQDTRLRENYQQAVAQGKVISLTSATAPRRNTSMRSTFQSISASVTAMRAGSLKEREVKIEQESIMVRFRATRMVLNADFDKVNIAPRETPNGRIVLLSEHPFAQGGLRNVYRMKQKGERRQVAKESRHDIKYQKRLQFHLETAKCQAQAAIYAKQFNKKMKKASKKQGQPYPEYRKVDFLSAEVYRLSDERYPGGFRYLAVEQEMTGTYDKWNNNNGYVNTSTCVMCQTAQAFSHFSYDQSGEQEMVVDIQGGQSFTDPQLHSLKQDYGGADKGKAGFEAFFKTHKCNSLCKVLGLPDQYPNL